MPTSKSECMPNVATDSPLGAPGGNDPHKTVRAKNWANPEKETAPKSQTPYETQRAGNTAFFSDKDAEQ